MLVLFILFIVLVLAVNISLWKFGFVHSAEKPIPLIDKPMMDAKEQKAITKRLKRWREEGRITREEWERFSQLCRSEWDEKNS